MSEPIPHIEDQIKATLLGQCIGDAIGLLTEFMIKEEAKKYYGKKPKQLSYSQKVPDMHRSRWQAGDWTDDSDQMILILQGILYNRGQVLAPDFAQRIHRWMKQGFPEHGDFGGLGLGATTSRVLHHPDFMKDPHEVAFYVWDHNQRSIAPNGGVMRTCILGLHQWQDLGAVVRNTIEICKVTHHDPRCQASCVAVTSCIALMLQHNAKSYSSKGKTTPQNVKTLIAKSYEKACTVLETEEQRKELWQFMSCKKIKDLKLCEGGKIGYTYKCMGAGFWALKQENFTKAMIKLVMEAGDADTNGAVAGALLACKMGSVSSLPDDWVEGLKYKAWLMEMVDRFLQLQTEMDRPVSDRTANDDLSLENLREMTVSIRKEQQEKMAEEIKLKIEKDSAKDFLKT